MIIIHTHDSNDRQEFLQAFATIALDMHLYHELISLLPDAAAFPGIQNLFSIWVYRMCSLYIGI
jgi:hypothetical protein